VSLSTEILNVIDQRILAYAQQPFAMGTVDSRASSGSAGTVVFDGDSNAVPVKFLANVHVFPPDRVLMVRVAGSSQRQPDVDDTRKPSPGEWVVVGGFTRREGYPGGYTMSRGIISTPTNTTLATFITLPDAPALSFTKQYDDTAVLLMNLTGSFSNTATAPIEHAMQLNGTDYVTGGTVFSSAHHSPINGIALVTGVPAGTYSIAARWRSKTAGVQVSVNAGDYWSFSAEEIAP
jgi:hypothetical protein